MLFLKIRLFLDDVLKRLDAFISGTVGACFLLVVSTLEMGKLTLFCTFT